MNVMKNFNVPEYDTFAGNCTFTCNPHIHIFSVWNESFTGKKYFILHMRLSGKHYSLVNSIFSFPTLGRYEQKKKEIECNLITNDNSR